GSQNPLKSSFLKGFSLTASEKQDLIAFLQSLTDETFITNPALSDPRLADTQ
ncbi:MAG: di-heme enzyme, partial [Cyanobacteria bacterium P01_A01_bin.114]